MNKKPKKNASNKVATVNPEFTNKDVLLSIRLTSFHLKALERINEKRKSDTDNVSETIRYCILKTLNS